MLTYILTTHSNVILLQISHIPRLVFHETILRLSVQNNLQEKRQFKVLKSIKVEACDRLSILDFSYVLY